MENTKILFEYCKGIYNNNNITDNDNTISDSDNSILGDNENEEVTIYTLNNACSVLDLEKIKYCLNQKISPNEKSFNNLFSSISNKNIFDRENRVEKIIDCIDIFTKHFGYILTKENVLTMTRHEIYHKCFHEHYFDDPNFIKSMQEICDEKCFWFPYDIKLTQNSIKAIITKKKDYKFKYDGNHIKTWLETHKLKTTIEHILLAAKNRRTDTVIKILIAKLDTNEKISKDDFINLAEYKIELPMVQEHQNDKEFMEKLKNTCEKNKFFAYGTCATTADLKKLLKHGVQKISIENFIKNNKIKPDLECVKEACRNSVRHGTILYLLELIDQK
jgi:hypothetical protein